MINDCSPKEQTALLTVAASVFTVGAALVSAGSSAAIGLTIAGATAQAVGGVPREDPERVEFNGKTPDAIIGQLRGALNRLINQIATKEQQIADALSASAAYLAANRNRFVSPRPALADATAATVTGPDGLGEAV